MNKSTIIDSALCALSKDKVTTSLSASRDQWLKHLEEETLKKRKENIDVSAGDGKEENIQGAAAEKENCMKYNAQPIENTPEVKVRSKLHIDLSGRDKTFNNIINCNTTVDSKDYMQARLEEQNTHFPTHLGLQKEKATPKVVRELLDALLQKEQKYFDLKQPFTVSITESGIKVWLSDSSASREQYQQILHRLREGLRYIGVNLIGLSINGEKIWDQQNTLEINDDIEQDNCINKVY